MTPNEESISQDIVEILKTYMSGIIARSILTLSVDQAHVDTRRMSLEDIQRLNTALERGIQLYIRDSEHQRACTKRLTHYLDQLSRAEPRASSATIIEIREESDIVKARAKGRELCLVMGFSEAEQIKVATAISELARNIVQYAGQGEIALTMVSNEPKHIQIVARDWGPGIGDVDAVLSGGYRSKRGMGIGLKGTRNLMDEFKIRTKPGGGTLVTICKYLAHRW
jgi:serine/threonine-protein kinase RsbT